MEKKTKYNNHNWQIKKLGELCRIKPPKKEARDQLNPDDFVSFVPMEDLGILTKNFIPKMERQLKEVSGSYTYFANNDVLLAKITPCFENGKIGIARNLKNGIGFGSSEYIVFRSQGELFPDYLYYYLVRDQFRQDGAKVMTGAVGHKRVPKDFIENQEIPFPPLPEQKRIVAILDDAFAAIDQAKENAEKNLDNARGLFESYLQGVFAKKGEDWEEKTLGEIGKPSMCKRILKHQTATTGEIPFYKIGTFGKTPNAFISKEIYDEFRIKYSFPKKGDILISASGTIGRRVRYDGEPAFFQDSNIVWIDNDEKQVLNDYLYVFYEFCDWQPSKGATISRLYNSNLTSINIVFPKSLEEQKKLLKKIDAVSTETKKLEAIYQQKLNNLEELKKSILQKAFAGEL